MRNFSNLLKILLLLAITTIIITYAYYKTRDFVYGPTITINYPNNGTSVYDSLIEVEGTAKRISYISINDRQIFTDENGSFKEKLLIYPGYNIITIKASDKFDRNTKKTLEIVYKKKEDYKNETPYIQNSPLNASTTNETVVEDKN